MWSLAQNSVVRLITNTAVKDSKKRNQRLIINNVVTNSYQTKLQKSQLKQCCHRLITYYGLNELDINELDIMD